MQHDDQFIVAQNMQRKAKNLFDVERYDEALPIYQEAACQFRALQPIPWVRVFFCEATAIRCLEQLLNEGTARLSEYNRVLPLFLAQWSEATIKSRITQQLRCREAIENRAWRESRGLDTDAVALSIQHALIGDFSASRAVLDSALDRIHNSINIPAHEILERMILSRRIIIDVLEEEQKPDSLRNTKTIFRKYVQAARACRLRNVQSSFLETRLLAFRALYLSFAAKWAGNADLRAIDQGVHDSLFGLCRAASRFERAFKLSQIAMTATVGGVCPKSHQLYLNYWQLMVRSRAATLEFVTNGNPRAFNIAFEKWDECVKAAEAFSKIADEERLFPNRFYSLKDLANESHWLHALKSYYDKKWDDCFNFLVQWEKEFPLEYRDTWRHRQGRIRLVFVKALLYSLGREMSEPAALREEIRELQQRRSHSGPGRAAEQLLNYAFVWTTPPLNGEAALLVAQTCGPLLPFDARIAGTTPLDYKSSRLQALPDDIGAQLLQPTPGGLRPYLSWQKWFFAAYGNLLHHMEHYYSQLTSLTFDKSMSRDKWELPNGMEGTLTAPLDAWHVMHDKLNHEALLALWEGPEEQMSIILGDVMLGLEQLARFSPVVIEIETVQDEQRFETAEAKPDWNLPDTKIELLRPKCEGKPLLKGRWYLPPEYGTGYVKTFCRIGRQTPLVPVSLEVNWDRTLEQNERLDFTTLFRHVVADHLALVFNGEAKQETEFSNIDVSVFKEDCVVAVAEVGVSFRGKLREPYKVRQAVAARQAIASTNESVVTLVVTNAADVSEEVLSLACAKHVRIWQANLYPDFRKCISDPRHMAVNGFKELYPLAGANAAQIDVTTWPVNGERLPS